MAQSKRQGCIPNALISTAPPAHTLTGDTSVYSAAQAIKDICVLQGVLGQLQQERTEWGYALISAQYQDDKPGTAEAQSALKDLNARIANLRIRIRGMDAIYAAKFGFKVGGK